MNNLQFRLVLSFGLGLWFILLLAGVAYGQTQNCAPTAAVNERLTTSYGESVVFDGLAANNQIGRLFLNPETGSWTFVVDLPSGLTCLIASGEFGELGEATPPGDPA